MSQHVTTFTVRNRRVPNLSAHLARIRDAASVSPIRVARIREELGQLGEDDYQAFITASAGQANVMRRPASSQEGNILAAVPVPDRRQRPTVKGPDLGWQNQQMLITRNTGAHDSLLQAEDGAVVSSLRSALLVFPPEEPDTAFYSGHPSTTYSVTLGATLDWLREHGVEPRRKVGGFRLAEIFTGEVWTLDSVSGIRRIEHWMEYRTKRTSMTLADATRGHIPTAEAAEAARWDTAEEL